MRNEVMVGGILGLVLGGLVTFGLSYEPMPSSGPQDELAPLQLSDSASWDHDDDGSTDGGHRPVRPGSERVYVGPAAQS